MNHIVRGVCLGRGSQPSYSMTQDQELIDYLLLLRFGTSVNPATHPPIMNFASISKVIKKPL